MNSFFFVLLWLGIMPPQSVSASTDYLKYNNSFLEQVLLRIGRNHWPTNMPVFISHFVDASCLDRLMAWLHNVAGTTSFVFHAKDGKMPYKSLRDQITDDTLTLLLCHGSEDIIWAQLDQQLRKLRPSKLLVMLPENSTYSPKAMYRFFKKLWQLQFLNAIVLYQCAIYRYTPYPKVYFFRLADNDRNELFPAAALDFQGYVVATPAENDIPRVFFITDPNSGRPMLRGFGYHIFQEFLHRRNATLYISNARDRHDPTMNVNMSNINRLIGQKQLEISLHPYTGIDRQMGQLSYPVLKARNCLIVPVRNEVPRLMYLLRPFHAYTYLLLCVGTFYIAATLYWLSPRDEWRTRFDHFMHNLLESFSHLLYLSPTRRIYAPRLSYLFVVLLLSILGFCLTNLYTNTLSSFLTTVLVGEQFDSFEQLIDNKLHILAKSYETEILLEQVPIPLRQQVASLIVGVNASVQFFKLQQQYAHKPLLRYSSICFGEPIIGFPMRHDSHLESPLRQFILEIQKAGLLDHWIRLDFVDALRAGYVRLVNNELPFKALDIQMLTAAWVVLLVGWSSATLAFVMEHYAFRYGRSAVGNVIK